jgi:nucleoside-diphosphate kinase
MSERTCLLVKPDGVGQRRVGAVIDRLERAGLRLAGLRMLKLSRGDAEAFYKEHHGKPFYEGLIRFMTAAPLVATAWEGPDAVATVRSLMGATNSAQAAPETLRREFGTDNRYNLVHGSDSPASAAREIAFFFKPEELFAYGENDWKSEVSSSGLR